MLELFSFHASVVSYVTFVLLLCAPYLSFTGSCYYVFLISPSLVPVIMYLSFTGACYYVLLISPSLVPVIMCSLSLLHWLLCFPYLSFTSFSPFR